MKDYSIEGSSNEDSSMAWDLRQYYARIVGEHLIKMCEDRQLKNYPDYFKDMENINVITQHNFKDLKKNKNNESYEELRKKLIEDANVYQGAWAGKDKTPNKVAIIENALRKIEEYLWLNIHEAGMLGKKFEDEGL